jgi:hypothetical protein
VLKSAGSLMAPTSLRQGFKRVCIIKLLKGMDKVGVGGDYPLVEEQIPGADGGTSVIEADKGDSGINLCAQVKGNGGHHVVDMDWEWRKTGAACC